MCWLDQYPKGQVPIESSARIAALKNLFIRLKKEGYPKEYFTNTVKGNIISNCINPNHPNKRKKKIWIQYASKHLEIAFEVIYDENVIMEENDMLAAPVSKEDLSVSTEVEEIQKAPKNPKVEYYTENAPKGTPTVNQIDPEMAALLGLYDK